VLIRFTKERNMSVNAELRSANIYLGAAVTASLTGAAASVMAWLSSPSTVFQNDPCCLDPAQIHDDLLADRDVTLIDDAYCQKSLDNGPTTASVALLVTATSLLVLSASSRIVVRRSVDHVRTARELSQRFKIQTAGYGLFFSGALLSIIGALVRTKEGTCCGDRDLITKAIDDPDLRMTVLRDVSTCASNPMRDMAIWTGFATLVIAMAGNTLARVVSMNPKYTEQGQEPTERRRRRARQRHIQGVPNEVPMVVVTPPL
jgi:hypothetical protein